MTDYYPLIARAVSGLAKNTGENRRALYERARTALVGQLKGLDPPLADHEITRERLLLEEAIRKVESEAARSQRPEPRPSTVGREKAPPAVPEPKREQAPEETSTISPEVAAQPAAPATQPDPGPATQPDPAPTLRPEEAKPGTPRWAGQFRTRDRERSQESAAQALKGFRDLVAEVHGGEPVAPTPPDAAVAEAPAAPAPPRPAPTKPSRAPATDRRPPEFATSRRQRREEAPAGQDYSRDFDDHTEPQPPRRSMREILAAADASEARAQASAVPQRSTQPRQFAEIAEAGLEPERDPRRWGKILLSLLVALLVVGAGLAAYSQRDNLRALFTRTPTAQAQREAAPPSSRPKISDRVGQAGQPATNGTPDTAAGPAVAQRVVLYEDDPSDPQGKPYVGNVVWQTETKPPSAGQAAETSIRADLDIADRRIKMTMFVRRNFDKALPASHTIEIMFNLPPDFAFGGISNVPGILMKEAEQTRGAPLAGLAVKVTSGYFLIGLSGSDEDMRRNLELLRSRAWFDIPIVYSNGRRAILAVEKGAAGDRAFQQAFATWGE